MSQTKTQSEQYWVQDFQVTQSDIDHLYSVLLEREIPLSVDEMALILVRFRIHLDQANQTANAYPVDAYRPSNKYSIGDEILFPRNGNHRGKVIGKRDGTNSAYGTYKVMSVTLDNDVTAEFASDYDGPHDLNIDDEEEIIEVEGDRTPEDLFIEFGGEVASMLETRLLEQKDLVRLAGRWFPKSLLLDVNEGHLNLAEAVLDMAEGGPLTTRDLIEQSGVMGESNERLAEFSLNFGLQQDERFDEVGPAGQVLWFLHRLEPAEVQAAPPRLAYNPITYDRKLLNEELRAIEVDIGDEHSELQAQKSGRPQSVPIMLTYPHKRSGTLPLSPQLRMMFPTAYESPRIRFTIIDAETGEEMAAWVVRPGGYVYGLKDWFAEHEVPVGGQLTIKRTDDPARVQISLARRKPRVEWVRTASVVEGRLRFENRKLAVGSAYDELMIMDVDDHEALDELWKRYAQRGTDMSSILEEIFQELAPLGPQRTVHSKTLYSALNLVRKCPPGPIFAALVANPKIEYVGNGYWRARQES